MTITQIKEIEIERERNFLFSHIISKPEFYLLFIDISNYNIIDSLQQSIDNI